MYMHLFVVFTIPAFGMFETRGSPKNTNCTLSYGFQIGLGRPGHFTARGPNAARLPASNGPVNHSLSKIRQQKVLYILRL